MKLRALDKKVKELMKQRKDYAYYYYIPYNAEFVYESREFEENDSGVFAELDEATIKEIHKEREGIKHPILLIMIHICLDTYY